MTTPIPHHIQRIVTPGGALSRRLGAALRSNRVTLAGAFLLAVIIPELLHPFLIEIRALPNQVELDKPELIAATLTLLAAHFSLQKISILPLVDDKIIILPTILVCYAVNALVMSLAFRSFGHYHLLTSMAVVTAWYYFIALSRSRLSAPRLAFVGSMPFDEELLLTRIEWVPLDEPVLPFDVLGIVYDRKQILRPSYERLFARAALRNIPVYELGELREMVTGRVQLQSRPQEAFGQLLPSQPYLRIKRVFDLLTSLPALVLALPIIGLFGVLVSLESSGPIIFRQERIGYQGRRFGCYKLRTMRTDISGPAFTVSNDPRITRLGRFMRRVRIDELPQIFNVVKGDMSWIGPRPEAVSLARGYAREIPYYGYRHLVRPGITGWAAVHQGNVALTDAATRKLEYDFYYIKHFSPWLDCLIVLMTVRTILTGFGSR